VVDAEQTQAFSEQLSIVISIGPLGVVDFGDLPAGLTGVDYSFTLLGTGGSPPYTWTLSTGTLPAGLTLNPTTGRISGRPILVGSDTFILRITDSTGASALSSPSLRIIVGAGPLTIVSTGTLTGGTVNMPYTAQLQHNGGRQPFTWSLASGALPTGLTLNGAGAITGTPTAAGTFTFSVRVVDGASTNAVSGTLTIIVSP
jgi:hypothetical protein